MLGNVILLRYTYPINALITRKNLPTLPSLINKKTYLYTVGRCSECLVDLL